MRRTRVVAVAVTCVVVTGVVVGAVAIGLSRAGCGDLFAAFGDSPSGSGSAVMTTNPSPEVDPTEYWTEERMASAVGAPMGQGCP